MLESGRERDRCRRGVQVQERVSYGADGGQRTSNAFPAGRTAGTLAWLGSLFPQVRIRVYPRFNP